MKTMRTASIKPCPHCGCRIEKGEQYVTVETKRIMQKRTQLHTVDGILLLHAGCIDAFTAARK